MMLRIVIFVSTLITFAYMFSQHDYWMKHEHATLDSYNRSFLKNPKLINVKRNRTFRAYDGWFNLLKDLDGDQFKLNIKARRIADNIPKIKLLEFDVRICDALKSNAYGAQYIINAGNVTQCPIKKGYYYLKNCNVEDSQLPPYIPAGRYSLELTFILGNTFLAHVEFYVEIIYYVKHQGTKRNTN